MKFHELRVSRQKPARRSGRGISAGRGKTAGRGTKGQGSRKSAVKAGFEGGQTPIAMRIPKKPGFKSLRLKAENVSTSQLNEIKKTTVTAVELAEAGFISSPYVRVKLILGGDLSAKKDVKLPAASKSAIEAVKKAGGTFESVDRLARPAKLKKSE